MSRDSHNPFIILILYTFSFGCLCCSGCGGDQQKRDMATADQLYSTGNHVAAVERYKSLYEDRETSASDKERILPRIVAQEVKSGNHDEAKAWIKRGLSDKFKIDCADTTTKGLVAEAQKDLDEAKAWADEEKRKADAETARRFEEELDSDGLALLKNSLSGKTKQFPIEITGTVVNRRSHDLSYAWITFNLYDKSGAQVGTARANITGLAPGGRWNFKAVGIANAVHTYKFFELSGY